MIHRCSGCGRELNYEGLCWTCRAQEERDAVLAWSVNEIEEKLNHLIEHAERLDDWNSEEYRTAHQLLEVRGICPPQLQLAAAKADVTYFESLYYHAPEEVRDIIINKLLETQDPHKAGKWLSCLAMQGDEKALEVMWELKKNPKPWRKKLYVDPDVYAQCGGWTFDEQGQRSQLIYDRCYPLIKGDPKADDAVRVGRVRDDVCPHCGCRQVDMLALDGLDPRLSFLGIDGIVTASCCPNCVGFFGPFFSRYTLDGGSTPISLKPEEEENYIGENELARLADNALVLGDQPVPLFYGCSGDGENTIGGLANWVQDWEYTICPDCGKTMKYLAQLQWDTLIDGMEGTLFIEICPECCIVSMGHQQT